MKLFIEAAKDFAAYHDKYDDLDIRDAKAKCLVEAYLYYDGLPETGVLILDQHAYYYAFHPREDTLLWFQSQPIITDGSTPQWFSLPIELVATKEP